MKNPINQLYSLFALLRANQHNVEIDYSSAGYDALRQARGTGWRDALRQGLSGRNWEMEQLQEDVANEQRGCVTLVGHNPQLLQILLEQLRQQPLTPEPGWNNPRHEGLFTLITLPLARFDVASSRFDVLSAATHLVDNPTDQELGQTASSDWDYQPSSHPPSASNDDSNRQLNALLAQACESDCVLYVWPIEEGWQPAAAQSFARLRSMGVALLPVATRNADDATDYTQQLQRVQQRVAIQPLLVTLRHPFEDAAITHPPLPSDLAAIIDRILALRPRLAIPLAADLAGYRPTILRRILRQGALLTALFGAEPLPLIDLPLQVAVSWKMALQIAAVYGRPGLDYRSREMMSTLVTNLVTRAFCQQLLKLTPLIGWALSAAVSGGGAWLLGRALVRYYERGAVVKWPDPALQQAWQHAKESATSLLEAGANIGKQSWQSAYRQWEPFTKLAQRAGHDRNLPTINFSPVADESTDTQELPIHRNGEVS